MMGFLSFAFEGVLAVLMVMLIAYCVKLNRGLVAIRSSDTQINELIGHLVEASDRAEAAVAHLKAVGVEQERSLRAAIRDAEQVRARLAPATGRGRETAETIPRDGAATLPDSPVNLGQKAQLSGLPVRHAGSADDTGVEPFETRSENEQALLAAIRHARAAR